MQGWGMRAEAIPNAPNNAGHCTF